MSVDRGPMSEYLSELRGRLQPGANGYLLGLRDGSMTPEEFLETQIQFLFAVVFFSRPMASLAGRLPRAEMRLAILDNVNDEHGEGNLSLTHERTFLAHLSKLGASLDDIDRRALWPEVRIFNTTLAGVCLLDDTFTALAALGMIESLFAGISLEIGRSMVSRGWMKAEEVEHYAVHADLDEDHAEGFFSLLYEPYVVHPRHRYQIQQGLEMGAAALLGMYDGLWRARARRWTREVRGPHSLADGWYLEPGGR